MTRHKHRWIPKGGLKENPGVFASGGSVVLYHECEGCGAYRRADYWDHRQNRPRRTPEVTITEGVES
jgi:hypothetical protein